VDWGSPSSNKRPTHSTKRPAHSYSRNSIEKKTQNSPTINWKGKGIRIASGLPVVASMKEEKKKKNTEPQRLQGVARKAHRIQLDWVSSKAQTVEITRTHCKNIQLNINPNGNAQYTVATPETKENAAQLPLKTQTKIQKKTQSSNPECRSIFYNNAESQTMDIKSNCMQRYPYGRNAPEQNAYHGDPLKKRRSS
jgi:hypothetical protein